MISASVDADGDLTLLVDGGAGGSIMMHWFNASDGMAPYAQPPVSRVQFVDADGVVRVFDLAAAVASRQAALGGSGVEVGPFGDDAAAFELTGTAGPAGTDRAVAYAQTGDLFGNAFYASGNVATADADVIIGGGGNDVIESGQGDDLISGGAGGDVIDGGEGDDRLDGGAGNDVLMGGEGDDTLVGGDGSDQIYAGPGRNSAAGGQGDDTYYFNQGDGTLSIDDDAQFRGPNTIVFGFGISSDALRLGYDGNT